MALTAHSSGQQARREALTGARDGIHAALGELAQGVDALTEVLKAVEEQLHLGPQAARRVDVGHAGGDSLQVAQLEL